MSDVTDLVIKLEDPSARQVGITGGKGASLANMIQANIPVPPGFVVTAKAFEDHLSNSGVDVKIKSVLNKLNFDDLEDINAVSDKVKDLIINADLSKGLVEEIEKLFKELDSEFVAVRSSATAEDSKTTSWAGELETFLNTSNKNLIENIKKCWASLFSARAIAYQHEQKLDSTKVSVAVVVQKMVESEISGITFTVHPVTNDDTMLFIEAGWGLGELIVGGEIIPDEYLIDKNTGEIIESSIGDQDEMLVRSGNGNARTEVPTDKKNKPKLGSKEVNNLVSTCLIIEKYYGFPCDIEWAIEKNSLYIVQSRPITTV